MVIEVQVRKVRGKEFQMVGAAKEKDLRPTEDLMKGTVRRDILLDLRFLEEEDKERS